MAFYSTIIYIYINGMEAVASAKGLWETGKTIGTGFQTVAPYLAAGAALV